MVKAMTQAPFTEEDLRDLYEQQRLSLRAIAELRGCHPRSVWHQLALFRIPRRSISEAKLRYERTPFSGIPIERAYLLGFRAGDLHVYKANHSATSQTIIVAGTSTSVEQTALVAELFKPYGRVHLSTGPRQTVVTCYLDLSFTFLLEKPSAVPRAILDDRESFAAFLAGYVDAEGCIQVKRYTKAAEVIIRSYDVQILRDCHIKLQ
jgi:hypothetical protein